MKQPDPDIFQHPLMGVRLSNLWQVLKQNGGIPVNLRLPVLLFGCSALARLPFSLLERALYGNGRRGVSVEKPVIIVGYWRSGTTHLHNLLAQNDSFGIITPIASGLPGELLTLGSWFEGLMKMGLPEDRGVDRVKVTIQSPQEDEIPVANLQPLSVYHALYFPHSFRESFNRGVFFEGVSGPEVERWKRAVRHFTRKVARHQGTGKLLLKNPVYTCRIDHVLDMWPDARIVHIYRNPYEVYVSTKQYFEKMLAKLALQPYTTGQIEEIVKRSYPRMLNKLYADTEELSPEQFAEVRYEDIVERPLAELKRIYERLGIGGWQRAGRQTEAYLEQVAGYKTNTYAYRKEEMETVREQWGRFVRQWGYAAPE